jgi:hypothetical protein
MRLTSTRSRAWADSQRERSGSSDVCSTWFYWGDQAESIRQGSMDSISEAAVG